MSPCSRHVHVHVHVPVPAPVPAPAPASVPAPVTLPLPWFRYFLLAFLHIPFGAELRSFLSLRADSFDQPFWMHALVTSVSSL
eukprot:5941239-Prymnesium_polylepis.1